MEARLPTNHTKPFLKWAGGKGGLLDYILPLVPRDFNAYFEPFLGGGALFFALKNMGKLANKSVTLSDKNAELINAYKQIEAYPNALIHKLESLKQNHSKEQYYAIRNLDRSADFRLLDSATRAARFIYLNKTCFNGLCRYNAKGQFNTPMGSYANPSIFETSIIESVHNALQGVEIICDDFEAVANRAKSGDFIYFDPPYFPLSRTSSFTSYIDNFSMSCQERLANVFRKLDSMGVKVLQSNSNTPFVRELYKDFELIEVSAKRAINCKGDKRGEVSELIIRGRY